MDYESESLGVSFSLPDRLTVREQLAYRERAFMTGDSVFERIWLGAVPLIKNWKCDHIPDPAAVDLATETSAKVARVVAYVANVAAEHVASLDDVPKN
jgi:hypothetical protein